MPRIADWRWPFFTVDIELTNHCRQNCLFCPREKLTRPAGFIEFEVLQSIVRKLAEIGSRITFCGMGNPLLHPDFSLIAEFCRSINGLSFGYTVQAPALNSANRKLISDARPGFIEISFPTFDPGLFEQIFPGCDFAESLDFVMKLRAENPQMRGLTVIAIKTEQETRSEDEITGFWHSKGFDCRLTLCHSRGGNLTKENLISTRCIAPDNCGLFATHSFVTWQGELLACCHDLTGETKIADLKSSTICAAGQKKLAILNDKMPFEICKICDEPAAFRALPDRDYPESSGARRRFMKKWLKAKQSI